MSLATLLCSQTIRAADKSGVSPNSISLPKGPGSIEGLGESFQPTLNTGTAKYSVALSVPPGTAGQTPGVRLYYEGGDANGPLGFGWTLPGSHIQRRTDKGVPLYAGEVPPTIADDWSTRYDNFINDSKEELVPTSDGFYFCKNEGAFIRYQRTNDYWVATVPDGTRLEFGTTADARIQDTNGSPARVFSWLLQRETDTRGNAIVYAYTNFPGMQNSNQIYLTEIRYGPGSPPWQNFHFVRFLYEERPDWFEDCRSGFAVRTGRRLAQVDVGTQGPTLDGHLQGDFNNDGVTDNLVRRYELKYLNYAGTNTHWSLLAEVARVGADGTSRLPSSTFGYTVCNPPDTLSAANKVILSRNEPTQLMNNTNVDLIDLNGDALPDLLDTAAGGGTHRAFLNLGETEVAGVRTIGWTNSLPMAGDTRAGTYPLSLDTVHLADLDGDGLADLVSQPVANTIYLFRNLGRASWGNRRTLLFQDVAPPSPYGNAEVRTADLDFDKQIDLLQAVDASRYFVWLRLGPDRYSARISRTNAIASLFSQLGVQVADINGDRVPDIARIRQDSVVITVGFGYGRFSEPRVVGLDTFLTSVQVQNARLQDITGDGMADLVIERAAGNALWYWVNLGHYQFSRQKVISGLPAVAAGSVVRWADLNGNGSTDLIYAGGIGENRLKVIDVGTLLNCGPTPNLLTAISNGIGRVTLIGYASSTKFAAEDAASGRPWTNAMPFPVQVVTSVTNLDSLGHEYRTDYRYHDAYYDPVEKQFRGFARAEQVDHGDASAPTLISRAHFDTGRDYPAMKGRLLRVSAETEGGQIFNEAVTRWAIPPRVLLTGTNGTNVSYAHPVSQQKRIVELGQGAERLLESEVVFDNFGNQTTNIDYGIVENGDRRAFHDERVNVTEYAIDVDRWILRLPRRTEVRNLDGTIVSRTDSYYDDETFSGGNFGLVTIGNLTSIRSWISPSNSAAQIVSGRTQYDSYGNPIRLLDPLASAPGGIVNPASGHYRGMEYDARFHAYPIRETVVIGSGREALAFEARYDEGFGTIRGSVDYNGNATTYDYDTFARLVRVVKPYDTGTEPTVEYEYRLAVPVAEGGLVNYVETRCRDKAEPKTPRLEMYWITRSYVDGLGRGLMTKQEVGPVIEGGPPRVVVKGAILFHARMGAAAGLNPFYSRLAGPLEQQLAYESIEAPGWRGEFQVDGRLAELDLAGAHKSLTRFDATQRAVEMTNPDGTVARSRYEPLIVRSYDENATDPASPYVDTAMVRFKDGLGRLIRVDEVARVNDDGTPAANLQTWTTRYEYDVNDQMTRATDSLGNVKMTRYDGLRRRILMNDPDRGVMSWIYDDASNVREAKDAKGQRITMTYDGANRVLTEDYHDEGQPFSRNFPFDPAQPVGPANRPDIAFFYDTPVANLDQGDGTTATAGNVKGRLAYVWDLTGEEHTSADARGRIEWTVKRVRDPIHGKLVAYRTGASYDALDRLSRHIYPDNDEIAYQYNDRSLLAQVGGEAAGPILSGVLYWPSEQPQEIRYGNGVQSTYSHDSRLRLRQLVTLSQPSALDAPLFHNTYDFDHTDNITAIHDRRPGSVAPAGDKRRNTQHFQYDGLYRLTRVQYSFGLPGEPLRNDGGLDYRYDRIGNMVSQASTIDHQENGLAVADLGIISYGGQGGRAGRQGRSAADPPGPHAMTRITHPQSPVPSREYFYDANGNMTDMDGLHCTWDFRDRLVAVENEKMRAQYAYDYAGRRVIKQVRLKRSGETATVIYPTTLFEVREYDTPVKYIWNGSTRVARVTGPLSHRSLIQRLRLHSGWNMVSFAVSGPLQLLNASAVQRIYRWEPATKDFLPVTLNYPFSIGDVAWIWSGESLTIPVVGAYGIPIAREIPAGDQFLACAGFQPWDIAGQLPDIAQAWAYNGPRLEWLWRAGGDVPRKSSFPFRIPAGRAFFVQSSAAFRLPAPEVSLQVRYYHQDHLGSTALLADSRGRVLEETANYPFGFSRWTSSTREEREPYGHSQKERDAETALHYFEARYVASGLSRFVSVDPLASGPESGWLTDPQRLNPYSYCGNAPVGRTDPNGMDWTDFGRAMATFAKATTAGAIKQAAGLVTMAVPGVAGVRAFEAVKEEGERLGRVTYHLSQGNLQRALSAHVDPDLLAISDPKLSLEEKAKAGGSLNARAGAQVVLFGVGEFVPVGGAGAGRPGPMVNALAKTEINALAKTEINALARTEVNAVARTEVDGLAKTQASADPMATTQRPGSAHAATQGATEAAVELRNQQWTKYFWAQREMARPIIDLLEKTKGVGAGWSVIQGIYHDADALFGAPQIPGG